ncbi:MAG: HNH endonuclease [Caulobacteraceae bacterium]|nr:HNH endonuclease [Caulobacteraceae bacterium]
MAEVSNSLKTALAESQNWRCAYCGVILDRSNATLDHVVPRAVGGRSHRLNLVCACLSCNAARGADIDAWTFWKIRI